MILASCPLLTTCTVGIDMPSLAYTHMHAHTYNKYIKLNKGIVVGDENREHLYGERSVSCLRCGMMRAPWLWEVLRRQGPCRHQGWQGRGPHQVKDELQSTLLGQLWVRTPGVWRLCLSLPRLSTSFPCDSCYYKASGMATNVSPTSNPPCKVAKRL